MIRIFYLLILMMPCVLYANEVSTTVMQAMLSPYAMIALAAFIIAYILVMLEDVIHLAKSKPVILAAGIIWVLTAVIGKINGQSEIVEQSLNKGLLEYGELLLFLLVAMTYIHVLEERNVFEKLKTLLLKMGLRFKGIFWLTGILAFFISPFADNLTTALILSAVVLSVGKGQTKFICLSCINIVVAANVGGAFSPFGDITTLMVWQSGIVPFTHFFALFIPALVSFIIPATIMSFFLPKGDDHSHDLLEIKLKSGAMVVIVMFVLTVVTAVLFQNLLDLPPALGMMTGLGYLMFLGFFLKKKAREHFDVFQKIQMIEWDTLLFFFGILLAVQGLATLGYLEVLSNFLYHDVPSAMPQVFDHITQANILIGLLSAIVDNIPVMFGVLTMHPPLTEGQWLLVTLTTGIGGSLLSIGSAAGVAVMGSVSKVLVIIYNPHAKLLKIITIMSVSIHIQCPRCNETNPVTCHGRTKQRKQRYRCDPKKDGCGKSFLQDYSNTGCLPEIKSKVVDMVLNGSGISDISRVLKISKTTVIETIKAKAINIRKINFDKVVNLSKITMLELSVELDEQWSWVQNKGNQRWLWAALDSESGEIIAFVFGKRTDNAFKELKKLLKHYKIKHFSSDGWGSYLRFLEEKLHTVSKALTTKIERKFLTLRTRIKRLCRKTICFSKSELMHDTVIGLFINKYEFGMQI